MIGPLTIKAFLFLVHFKVGIITKEGAHGAVHKCAMKPSILFMMK